MQSLQYQTREILIRFKSVRRVFKSMIILVDNNGEILCQSSTLIEFCKEASNGEEEEKGQES